MITLYLMNMPTKALTNSNMNDTNLYTIVSKEGFKQNRLN